MRIDILTLFPEMCERVLSESVIGKARKNGFVEVRCHNIRDYSEDKHRRVDDTPYGGGMGMLMAPPPIYNCYTAVTEDVKEGERVKTVYMSPRGTVLNEGVAKRIASECDRLIILCGHYEGVDQRIIDEIIDEEISIGDYVLTGGEIPACILVDCVSRLCEGVLSEAECHEVESFEDDLLEYPQYTRPIEFMGRRVPDILLSGHHAKIAEWRLERAEEITRERRPDLYEKYAARKAAKEAEKAAKKRRKEKTPEAEVGKNNE